ncbi:hypothetical protein [Paenibacillus pinistramenti]|uniref:hypothetical protein n=1 Tax=Paenibacillus pinistramenti TaxID=1768003 RepID=UPI00110923CB|nr:hypothetical protein [Paenibacillus pinistramenti]
MASKDTSSKREPGFDSIPAPDSSRPAPTDALDQVIGGMMDQIQEDATGEKPKNPSEQKDQG